MDSIKLLARNGEAVRHALELGEILHLETATEELTDEFLLFAIKSGLLQQWARSFPDPRRWSEISITVIIAASIAARFVGLYSLRKTGHVLRSARVFAVPRLLVGKIFDEVGYGVQFAHYHFKRQLVEDMPKAFAEITEFSRLCPSHSEPLRPDAHLSSAASLYHTSQFRAIVASLLLFKGL